MFKHQSIVQKNILYIKIVIIYDINGKKVKSLMNAKVSKGEFKMTWEGNDDQNQIVKQGTYIAVIIENGNKAGSVKIIKRK
ncbi:MAG: hypothetical protein JEY97_04300 [Bacteroidales bacterium]|nr:hypothetical protein [Bacteroidales bacterium]